jgi:hypothetical protein
VPHLAGSKQNFMRITKFLSAAFLLLSGTTYGQFKKGSTLLGGDISFSSQKTENLNSSSADKFHSFSISPVFAKAIKDNLFFGGSLRFESSKSTYMSNNVAEGQGFIAGVFVRKYKPIFGKFNAFVQAGINGGISKATSNQGINYDVESKGFRVYASVTPGISVGVSKKLYLEAGFADIASLGYSSQKQTGTSNGTGINMKTSSFNFSSSLSTTSAGLFFGIRFILPR